MDRANCSLKMWVNCVGFLKVLGCIVIVVVIGGLMLSATKQKSISVNVPMINIKLSGVGLSEINGNDKNIIYSDNELTVSDEMGVRKYGGVEIRGRGNYTWTDDKKPYQIRFAKKVNLFGIGEYKKWNLMTNNLDDSLMRNDLAQYLAEIVGEKYVMRGKFVHLVINDEDLGLYYLTKKISIGKRLVDLKDEYGVLVELDNNYCQYEDERTVSGEGDCLVFKDFVNKDLSEESMDIFTRKYNAFEKAALAGDYEMMKKKIDVESLAMYYLIGEFSGNPDAYLSSFYFYSDDEEDRIHVGPVWDFDGAFGNLNWGNGELEDYAYDPWSDEYRIRQFDGFEIYDENGNMSKVGANEKVSDAIVALAKMPEFMEMVEEIYNKSLRVKKNDVIEYLDEVARLIRDDALDNATRWERNSFDEAVEYLKWWVEQRFAFFDLKFGGVMRKLEGVEM